VNIPKEALIKSVTQSELPLIWGIYAPKVSIPLEGKVPTSSGGPDLRSPTLGDKGAGWEGKDPTPSLGPLVQTVRSDEHDSTPFLSAQILIG